VVEERSDEGRIMSQKGCLGLCSMDGPHGVGRAPSFLNGKHIYWVDWIASIGLGNLFPIEPIGILGYNARQGWCLAVPCQSGSLVGH